MKRKRLQAVSLHLEYLYSLALALPYRPLARTKCKELLALSRRSLCKLGKIKKTICRGCMDILIPKVTCGARLVRKQSGFGLQVVCSHCLTEQFTVIRGA